MKKIVTISLTAVLLFVAFIILYNVFSTIDIPQNIDSVTILDTISGKEKTINDAEAIKIVNSIKNAKKNYSIPACPKSNIRIILNSSENNGEIMWLCLSADDCSTLWCDNNISYHISDKCNQQLKKIIIDNGFSFFMP